MNEKDKMDSELIECVDEYDKDGYWVKRKLNGVPIFIPKQELPMVQIITPNTEWAIEKNLMTIEEARRIFPELPI